MLDRERHRAGNRRVEAMSLSWDGSHACDEQLDAGWDSSGQVNVDISVDCIYNVSSRCIRSLCRTEQQFFIRITRTISTGNVIVVFL